MTNSGDEVLKIVQDMQEVVEQMRLDDIEENPNSQDEMFTCSACGKTAPYAGSIQYGEYRLCNSCVLYAEVGFKLKKLENIADMIKAMEDKRLEELCDYIKADEQAQKN
ncbi:hypothetical protein IKA15_02655 [bacterium]|nr:hypothetical protein [bacterium]